MLSILPSSLFFPSRIHYWGFYLSSQIGDPSTWGGCILSNFQILWMQRFRNIYSITSTFLEVLREIGIEEGILAVLKPQQAGKTSWLLEEPPHYFTTFQKLVFSMVVSIENLRYISEAQPSLSCLPPLLRVAACWAQQGNSPHARN